MNETWLETAQPTLTMSEFEVFQEQNEMAKFALFMPQKRFLFKQSFDMPKNPTCSIHSQKI